MSIDPGESIEKEILAESIGVSLTCVSDYLRRLLGGYMEYRMVTIMGEDIELEKLCVLLTNVYSIFYANGINMRTTFKGTRHL